MHVCMYVYIYLYKKKLYTTEMINSFLEQAITNSHFMIFAFCDVCKQVEVASVLVRNTKISTLDSY